MQAEAILLQRDLLVMVVLTVALFFMSLGIRRRGRINRLEGLTLVLAYVGYTVYLIVTSR